MSFNMIWVQPSSQHRCQQGQLVSGDAGRAHQLFVVTSAAPESDIWRFLTCAENKYQAHWVVPSCHSGQQSLKTCACAWNACTWTQKRWLQQASSNVVYRCVDVMYIFRASLLAFWCRRPRKCLASFECAWRPKVWDHHVTVSTCIADFTKILDVLLDWIDFGDTCLFLLHVALYRQRKWKNAA